MDSAERGKKGVAERIAGIREAFAQDAEPGAPEFEAARPAKTNWSNFKAFSDRTPPPWKDFWNYVEWKDKKK